MTPKYLIEMAFESWIKETFAGRHDLLSFFLGHERKEKFINNLCQELLEIELRQAAPMDSYKLTMMVCDKARQFCKLAINTKLVEAGHLRKHDTDVFNEFGERENKRITEGIDNCAGDDPGVPDGVLEVDRATGIITDPNDGDKVIPKEKLR